MKEEYPTDDDLRGDQLAALREENKYLRGQITYLQEELSSVEDELDKAVDKYIRIIDDLEQQLGDALYRD